MASGIRGLRSGGGCAERRAVFYAGKGISLSGVIIFLVKYRGG